jgi:hypothetical protein
MTSALAPPPICPLCGGLSAARGRACDTCAAVLGKEKRRGVLLGLFLSPPFALITPALVWSYPMLTVVTAPAWVIGFYAYAVILALRGGARQRARAKGIAIAHTGWVLLAYVVIKVLSVWIANADFSIGGG